LFFQIRDAVSPKVMSERKKQFYSSWLAVIYFAN
jgi:hypothetical protein